MRTIHEIEDAVRDTLGELGIYVSMEDEQSDFDFGEYFSDSLQYITFIITLEEKLGVEIPDDMLIVENFRSLKAFAAMLFDVLSENVYLNK